MIFLISLALVALFIALCAGPLKKHPGPFYIGAVVIAAAVFVCTAASVQFPGWFSTWVWPLVSRSGLAAALFAAVMYAGALPNGSKLVKKLMPIRGQLSILACILTLGHNLSYGRTYFRRIAQLTGPTLAAAICSIVMLCIMLPLFVTSFRAVRRRMKAKRWKQLQRLAYGFYGLLYVHVMLLTVPAALQGRSGYLLSIFTYSVVFLGYAVCRISKALALRQKSTAGLVRRQAAGFGCAVIVAAILSGGVYAAGTASSESSQQAATLAVSASEEVTTSDTDAVEATAETETAPETATEAAEPSDTDTDTSQSDSQLSKDVDLSTEEPADEAASTEPMQEAEAETEAEPEADQDTDAAETVLSQEAAVQTEAAAQQSETAAAETAAVSSPAAEIVIPEASASASAEGAQASAEEQTAQASAAAEEPAVVSEAAAEPEVSQEPEVSYVYQNGTFTGTAFGYVADVTVSVTIQDDVITAISVVSYGDDDLYFGDAKAVISSILSAQSTNVDAISGATYSSRGILNAVANALASAKN